jgi:hypothetical protein
MFVMKAVEGNETHSLCPVQFFIIYLFIIAGLELIKQKRASVRIFPNLFNWLLFVGTLIEHDI